MYDPLHLLCNRKIFFLLGIEVPEICHCINNWSVVPREGPMHISVCSPFPSLSPLRLPQPHPPASIPSFPFPAYFMLLLSVHDLPPYILLQGSAFMRGTYCVSSIFNWCLSSVRSYTGRKFHLFIP